MPYPKYLAALIGVGGKKQENLFLHKISVKLVNRRLGLITPFQRGLSQPLLLNFIAGRYYKSVGCDGTKVPVSERFLGQGIFSRGDML
jgi:hypothetical protein